ncbi:MAG TPA: CoA transferase [Acidimicrobiales bacterium]
MVDLVRWASCGAMALTGDADGPPLAPPVRIEVLDEALVDFGLDAAVVAERAALLGLRRGGRRSCGGATRLLRAAHGWVALSLARPDDVAALPALFETATVEAPSADAAWPLVERATARWPATDLVERTTLLGLPCAMVGEGAGPFERRPTVTPSSSAGSLASQQPTDHPPVTPSPSGSSLSPRWRAAGAPLVVDLSGLWAGPLAASLLARAGADVIKVEDRRRPDGARSGVAAFYDLLNAGKRSVALDFQEPADRAVLRRLVERADIVISSARARAIDQLGLDPEVFLAAGSDRVWVAVTAHGWSSDRVGFGDDAAASAGLVAWSPADGQPRFAADALADPACGALAARAALDAWHEGGRWFVDASLSGAAGRLVGTGPTVAAVPGSDGWEVAGSPVAQPAVRSAGGPAAALGADTDMVLAALGRDRLVAAPDASGERRGMASRSGTR